MTQWTRHPDSALVSDNYQAEIDRTMRRAESRWNAEQAALAAAERRRQRIANKVPKTAKEKKLTRHQIRVLDEKIELHRKYLQSYENMMTSTGAPSENRGRKSFRPIPAQGKII